MTSPVIIIPARLNSLRFPRKLLQELADLPVIEHVRRRAVLNSFNLPAYVATGDEEIAAVVERAGGLVIRTLGDHASGTDRVAEAIKCLSATHAVLVQGDEPLFHPNDLDVLISALNEDPVAPMLKCVCPLSNKELADKSIVKGVVTDDGKIKYCFRGNPSQHSSVEEVPFFVKFMGLSCFTRKALAEFTKAPLGIIEAVEKIEEMRFIERIGDISSVPLAKATIAIDHPHQLKLAEQEMTSNPVQANLVKSYRG